MYLLTLCITVAVAQNAIQIQNGIDAKKLDDAKVLNVEGADCSGQDVVCLGSAIGQCVNGKLVKVSDCSGGTSCFVLPLVNKPGTSVSCDTQADKDARFAAAGVQQILPTSSSAPIQDVTTDVSSNVTPDVTLAGGVNKAGDFICIDDTLFKHFVSSDKFVVESCPPGFCATRNPPNKNPCIGKANADRIDKN